MAKRKNKVFDAVALIIREIVKKEAKKEEGGILKGKLIVRLVRSDDFKALASKDQVSVAKALGNNTLFDGRGLVYDSEEDTVQLAEFGGLLSSQRELLKSLGRTAIFVLSSSHLNENQPLLYFKLKDAAVILADLGDTKVSGL